MNTKKYMQTDGAWSELGYPKKPCTIGNSGCGEVSIANVIIEMKQYENYTPKTIQPYCKQFAEARCNGTYHSGIPTMMKHYGLTEVKEHATMDSLWKELAKGDRVAIYLMGSSPGGSKGVHWTGSGHFVCSVDYRYKNNDHQVYIKDSYSNSKDRNGWLGYNTHLRGVVSAVWSGKLNGAKPSPTPTPTPSPTPTKIKLTVDGIGGTQTIKRMQQFFKVAQDGVISGQNKNLKTLYPSLTAVQFGKGGSATVKALQKWLGVTADGIIGKQTTKAWQKKLVALGYFPKNETIDGIFGVNSMKKWQECLNNDGKKKGGTPDPKPAPTPTKDKYKVIDVSVWQGDIDWKKVKADGVVGAIIRYADGDTLDSKFAYNMKNAKANGIHIGSYIFSRAKTKAQAEEEATRLFNACKKYSPDLPLYIDLEAKGLEKYADTVAQAFLNKIKALGGKGGVYANLNWWNNYLTKTAKGSFAMWLAQYNDKMTYKPASAVGMWQYSSSGSVKGISGRVDMNWLYQKYWEEKPTPKPDEKKGYQGTFPSITLTKTNAKVKADACEWATKIAKNNDFHYGSNEHAYHNGCYYCGTNKKFKKGHGMKMWESTCCCNPFVGAAWAHGGGDATALKMCKDCDSWGFSKKEGYEKSPLFNKLGHPAKSKLKAGDVLCADSHVVLYIGDGKIAEAATRDDNVIGSKKWNDSIRVTTLTDARYKGLPRAYRYNGKVNCERVLSYGELSDRVADLQRFLIWYGYKISVTRFFNTATLEAVKDFQEKELGKGQGDGLVGQKTIDAMKKVKK